MIVGGHNGAGSHRGGTGLNAHEDVPRNVLVREGLLPGVCYPFSSEGSQPRRGP
jgi:hypothetical protein